MTEDKPEQSSLPSRIWTENDKRTMESSDLLEHQTQPTNRDIVFHSKPDTPSKSSLCRISQFKLSTPEAKYSEFPQLSLVSSVQCKPSLTREPCADFLRSQTNKRWQGGVLKPTGFFVPGRDDSKVLSHEEHHNVNGSEIRLKAPSIQAPPRLARVLSSCSQSSEYYDDRSPVFGGGLSDSSYFGGSKPRGGLSRIGSINSDSQYGGDEGAKPVDWMKENSTSVQRTLIHSEGQVQEEDRRPSWTVDEVQNLQTAVLLSPHSTKEYVSAKQLSTEIFEELENPEPDIALPGDSVIFLNYSDESSVELLPVEVEGRGQCI